MADGSHSHLLRHLQAIQSQLVTDKPNMEQLQQNVLEVAGSVCGPRDQTSTSWGAKAILSLLQSNYDSMYQATFELLEKLNYSSENVVSMLDAALASKVNAESVSKEGNLSALFSLTEINPGTESMSKKSLEHRRTLLTPDNYVPVLEILFSLQISNPHIRSMQLLQKPYLENEVVLDVPVSGDIGIWWGASTSADLLWVSAVWTSKCS